MVTILPKENDWSDAFQSIGKGFSQGYQNRADEMALQNAIGRLGANPTPRQILDAVTGTKTYNPQSKQALFKNYLGASEFEELQKKSNASQEQAKAETAESKRATGVAEKQRDRQLDIMENKSVKTHARAATDDQIKAGIQTVKEMRDIGKKGNLGIGTGIRKVFSGEAAKDAGTYEQLGKSLIQLSTTIPIRNKLEFETLAEKLYDPSIRDAEREGILDAMENILNRSIMDNSKEESAKTPEGKIRVKDKATGKTGTVTPFEGMDAKYDRI